MRIILKWSLQILGLQSIQEYVERSQLRWYGNVNRMDEKIRVKECMRQEK